MPDNKSIIKTSKIVFACAIIIVVIVGAFTFINLIVDLFKFVKPYETKQIKQTTINSNNVNNSQNNIPKQAYEKLSELFKTKTTTLQDRDKFIAEWKQKYKDLEKRLKNRSDEDQLIAKAKDKLLSGDLDGVEKLLEKSYENNLKKK